MNPHNKTARFAGLRDGDLIKKRDPWGARVIVALSMLLVLAAAVKVFAHTIDEVRAMPRYVEGFPTMTPTGD